MSADPEVPGSLAVIGFLVCGLSGLVVGVLATAAVMLWYWRL